MPWCRCLFSVLNASQPSSPSFQIPTKLTPPISKEGFNWLRITVTMVTKQKSILSPIVSYLLAVCFGREICATAASRETFLCRLSFVRPSPLLWEWPLFYLMAAIHSPLFTPNTIYLHRRFLRLFSLSLNKIVFGQCEWLLRPSINECWATEPLYDCFFIPDLLNTSVIIRLLSHYFVCALTHVYLQYKLSSYSLSDTSVA